jgi:hypothetical protein
MRNLFLIDFILFLKEKHTIRVKNPCNRKDTKNCRNCRKPQNKRCPNQNTKQKKISAL